MKHITINNPYWEFGSDMVNILEEEGLSSSECFLRHAQMLQDGAENLTRIATLLMGKDVEIDATTHMVILHCEDEDITADKLIEEGLGCEFDEFEDEEFDEHPIYPTISLCEADDEYCHCGDLVKNHTGYEGHSPVIMEDDEIWDDNDIVILTPKGKALAEKLFGEK